MSGQGSNRVAFFSLWIMMMSLLSKRYYTVSFPDQTKPHPLFQPQHHQFQPHPSRSEGCGREALLCYWTWCWRILRTARIYFQQEPHATLWYVPVYPVYQSGRLAGQPFHKRGRVWCHAYTCIRRPNGLWPYGRMALAKQAVCLYLEWNTHTWLSVLIWQDCAAYGPCRHTFDHEFQNYLHSC